MDELDRELATLAPKVDTAEARRLFDARRASLRRRRRLATGLTGVLAAVAVAGLVAALSGDEGEPLDVGGPALGPVQFEVLHEELVPLPVEGPRLRLVGDQEQLAGVLGADAVVGDVDFSSQVIVALLTEVECAELRELERDGEVLEPVLRNPQVSGECLVEPPSGSRIVVAIERSSLGDHDVLHLPADDGLGLAEAALALPSPLPFRVLTIQQTTEAFGTLRAATDESDLDALWDATGVAGEPPAVDLASEVVVSFTVADDNCRDPLVGFRREGDALTPVRAFPPGCEAPLLTTTYVAAIDREAVRPRFTLRLPEDDPFHEEVRLEVVIDTAPPSTTTTTEPAPEPGPDPEPGTGPVTFEVLAMGESAGEVTGTVRSATSDAGYRWLWMRSGLDGERPEVDLDEQVVVSITIPDDACPPELRAFERDGETITPVFVEPEGGCILPMIPKTYVVALDRSPLEPGFRLLLRGGQFDDFGDSTTAVLLSGPPPTPDCAAVEAFDAALDGVGVPADFSPSTSPDELVRSSVAVFRGRITGGSAARRNLLGERSLSVEVEFVELLHADPNASYVTGERHLVGFDMSPGPEAPEPLTPPPGTEVVVVAQGAGAGAPHDLWAVDEGFAFACDGGPLHGRVGFLGDWATIDSLDELADALRG